MQRAPRGAGAHGAPPLARTGRCAGPARRGSMGAMNEWDDRVRVLPRAVARTPRAPTWTRSSPGASRARRDGAGRGHRRRPRGAPPARPGLRGHELRRRRRHASPTSCARPRTCRSRTAPSTSSSAVSRRTTSTTPARRVARDGAGDAPAGRLRGHPVHRRARAAGREGCATPRTSGTTRARSSWRCSPARASTCARRRTFPRRHDMDDWLSATGCAGAVRRASVKRLLAHVAEPGGDAWTDTKWVGAGGERR